jgi:hypothetical protein
VGERERRYAANEAWFRLINDQIEANALKHGSGAEHYGFICECSNLDCAEPIRMTLADYERLRADPTHFVILPGHDEPEVETVVYRGDYWIVEKKGRAAGFVSEREA